MRPPECSALFGSADGLPRPKEIRDYATVMGDCIIAKLYPDIWKAFNDFHPLRGAMLLSVLDKQVIQTLLKMYVCRVGTLKPLDLEALLTVDSEVWPKEWRGQKKCSERDECREKLVILGIISE